MKILMVNKFLHPNGGSETYMFQLGAYLTSQGHTVEYFGMEHAGRQVGNSVNAYTTDMDFHNTSALQKLRYSLTTIYSFEARRQIRKVLDAFAPDVVHLNNINYQLTPSIIYEIKKHHIPMVQTVHDCQIACPSHRMYIERIGKVCSECLPRGNYLRCIANRCIADSRLKSGIAAIEAFYYHVRDTYNLVHAYICTSRYIAEVTQTGGVEPSRIHMLYHPTDFVPMDVPPAEQPYVLYFGRFCQGKGLNTLLAAASQLPEIPFVLAGGGPLSDSWQLPSNVTDVGFQKGAALKRLVAQAAFTVCPSEWYETLGYSVIESQVMGTPVIGSAIGGISENIEDGVTGMLFPAGDLDALKRCIQALWYNEALRTSIHLQCLQKQQATMETYTVQLMELYQSVLG